MNDERTPPRSKPSNDVKQSDIFSFFAGKTAAVNSSVPTSRTSRKSHLTQATNTPRHQVNEVGAHPTDETAIVAGEYAGSASPGENEIQSISVSTGDVMAHNGRDEK